MAFQYEEVGDQMWLSKESSNLRVFRAQIVLSPLSSSHQGQQAYQIVLMQNGTSQAANQKKYQKDLSLIPKIIHSFL